MTSPTLLLQTALEIAQGANGNYGTDDLPLVAALLRKAVAAAEAPPQQYPLEALEPPEAVTTAAAHEVSEDCASAASSLPKAAAKRTYTRKVKAKRRPSGVASIAEMMQELQITPSHSDSVRYGTRVAALYRRHTSIPAPKIGAVKMYPAEWLKDTLASLVGGQ